MLSIVKAVILNCIRDRRNFLFMILFPLFLVILIGTVTSGAFNEGSNLNFNDIKIYYLDEGNDVSKELFNTLKDIQLDGSKMNFKEVKTIEEGKNYVKIDRAILLELKKDSVGFYYNNESIIDSSSVYVILNTICKKFNCINEVYTINPTNANEIVSLKDSNFVNDEIITLKESPNSMGYYGVAEIGLMIFYFISFPIANLRSDKKDNIKDRIKLSGISSSKYYLASFLGFFIFSFMSVMITYILSNLIFNINYGNNLLIMPLATIPFLIIVIGLGIIITSVFKANEIANTILQSVIIPILVFLGGGYVALDDNLDGVFKIATNISPLRWFNLSIFRSIYSNDNSTLITWLKIGFISLIIIVFIICILGKLEDKMDEKYIGSN